EILYDPVTDPAGGQRGHQKDDSGKGSDSGSVTDAASDGTVTSSNYPDIPIIFSLRPTGSPSLPGPSFPTLNGFLTGPLNGNFGFF
ncbi:MAG: hypothetical protein K8I00_03790, partial [Candidatus Omnitrophica bacterium]|nr:hypothetical protein [Candidatus Omnitrophota bacterium]